MSPLDRPIRVTLFSDRFAKTKKTEDWSLWRLAAEIRKATAPTKEELPWLKCAEFGEKPSTGGSLRHDDNVNFITGIEGDYDGEEMPMEDAADLLEEAGIAAVLYTTPSHKDDAPRWRVLCPLAKDHPPEERKAFVERLNGVLGGVLKSESFALSQSFFFGAVKGKKVKLIFVEGNDCIDERRDLDRNARGPAKSDKNSDRDDSRSGRHFREAIRSVRAGRTYVDHLAGLDDELASYVEEARGRSNRGERDWERATEHVQGERKADAARFEEHGDETADYDGSQFLTAAQLCARPRPNDFVDGLLYEGLLSIWFGAPKSGKSFLLFDLATHVALGLPWANRAVEQRNVLVIPLEGEGLLQDRVRAWEVHHVKKCPVVFSPFPLHLINDKDRIAEIIAYCKANNVGLIIIDTLARAMRGGNENDFADVSRALAGADRIRTATGAHVILVHHTTKDGKSARGHSDLIGNPDLLVEISKPDSQGEFRKAIITENRHGREGVGLQFRVETVETDMTNKRGDRVTSGVAIINTEGFKDMEEEEQRDDAKQALEVLRRLYRLAPMIYDVDGIASTDWRMALDRAGLWPDTTNPNTRRSYFKRVKDRLVVAGLVDSADGKYWPVERKLAQ
jgi:hypothetical protein